MPIYFPQIGSTGITTQKPYVSGRSFNTVMAVPEAARPYSWAKYSGGLTNFPTGPLGAFKVNYLNITDAERNVLLTFFRDTAEGRLQEFVYLDPGGNLVTYSEDFSQAYWNKTGVSVGSAVSDPWGGNRATTLTATTSNSQMFGLVLP